MQSLCDELSPPALGIYAELPSDVGDFLGVYSQVARRIPESGLRRSIEAFHLAFGEEWLNVPELDGDRDTPRALWAMATFPNEETGDLARRWLQGAKLTVRELQRLQGIRPIKTSDHARRVLATLRYLLVEFGGYSRLVLLLDEFQRVGQATKKKRDDMNSGLHTFYSSTIGSRRPGSGSDDRKSARGPLL